MKPATKTVCIDAMNIGLAKGTGIATYGRNLLTNLNTMGMRTQILYGPNAAISKRPLLNEIALTDAYAPKVKPLARLWETSTARFGRPAAAIVPSEDVIWPAKGGGSPAVSAFWTSPRLYALAGQTFGASRVFTPVSFRDDPQVVALRDDARRLLHEVEHPDDRAAGPGDVLEEHAAAQPDPELLPGGDLRADEAGERAERGESRAAGRAPVHEERRVDPAGDRGGVGDGARHHLAGLGLGGVAHEGSLRRT